MLKYEEEFDLIKHNKKDIRYNFLVCIVFCQAVSDLLKKLEPHKLSLCILTRRKRDLDYHEFIGMVKPKGEYYHIKNLFKAYDVSVPDEIYNIYFVFKATQTKLHSTFKSNILDSNMENILIELFDISYHEKFKIEKLKKVLEDSLREKNNKTFVKI